MGRKPNPLLVEYFTRGKKINERSNRYEHTCKLCGEFFPKGRIEYLLGHLTKKCVGLSLADRTKIVLRAHDLADPSTELTAKALTTEEPHPSEEVPLNLPFSPSRPQNFNALNVLAEASRQVGGDKQGQGQNQDQGQTAPLDPQLAHDSFERQFLETSDDGMNMRNNGFPVSSGQTVPSLYPYLPDGLPVTQEELLGSMPLVSTNSPDLSTIAASANETLAHGVLDPGLSIPHDSLSTALLESFQAHNLPHTQSQLNWSTLARSFSDDKHLNQAQNSTLASTDDIASPSQPLRPIAMNPKTRSANFISESGTPTKVQKPKARGKFTPDRRKEVRELRRVGACMRCRMLKKTCSQETPCQTCVAVETPRLWKHSCVRTKLVETFPLYFVSLFGATAYLEVNMLKNNSDIERLDGEIEASVFSEAPIVFKGLRAHLRPSSDQAAQFPGLIDTFLVDVESENLTHKVEQYLRESSTQYVMQQEACPVLTVSLLSAVAIRDAKATSSSTPPMEKADNLIADVVDLCTATIILTEADLKWTLNLDKGSNGEKQGLQEEKGTFAQDIIITQLYAVIEKRAAVLCRAAMHHFEQRVLSRHKSSNFETFLAAFLLLTCAERISWLFQCYSHDEAKRSKWPLTNSAAADYATKGQGLASSIHLLLHMRQVEPKVQLDGQSGLLVAQNPEDRDLAAWLEGTGMSKGLLNHRSASSFDLNDCRSLDGTLSSRLLLQVGELCETE